VLKIIDMHNVLLAFVHNSFSIIYIIDMLDKSCFFFFQSPNRKALEKHYVELFNITLQRQTSARIRFMIEDLMDLRKVR